MKDKKKHLENLEDVDRALKKSSVQTLIERKNRRQKRETFSREWQRFLRTDGGILGIPLLVVVLTIMILILDPEKGAETEPALPPDSSYATVSDLPDENSGEEDDTIVRAMDDQTLTDFFNSYFTAKLTADVDTLARMSDVTNETDEQKKRLSSELKTQAGYIEAYQDIALYGCRGLDENARLVFVTYTVKFRRAQTAAPSILYCYMTRKSSGEWVLVENMTPEETKFVNSYLKDHEEVQSLIRESDSKLLEAISSDSRLAVLYDAFQTGRIYKEDQASIDSEVSLIGVNESEGEGSGESSASESAAESAVSSVKSAGPVSQSESASSEAVTEASVESAGEAVLNADSDPVVAAETTAQETNGTAGTP